jgi:hypothetical protein
LRAGGGGVHDIVEGEVPFVKPVRTGELDWATDFAFPRTIIIRSGYDNAETKERPNLHWLSLAVVVKTTGTKTGAKSVIFLKSPV